MANAGKTKAQILKELDAMRKQVAALQQTESRYRALFDGIADGVILHDTDGKILDVNHVTCERLGYKGEELLTMHLRDIVSARFARQIGHHVEQLKHGKSVRFETEYLTRDGCAIPCEVTEQAVEVNSHTIIQSVARDITERKMAEEALHRARQEWEGIFQAIGQPALILDRDYRVTAANEAARKAAGASPEHIVGKRCYEVFCNKEDVPPHCPMADMVVSGRLDTVEAVIEALGRWYLLSCTPVLDETGALARVIHIATDITGRKAMEEALRESEERWRLLVQNVPDIILNVARDGTILAINRTISGLTVNDVIGKNQYDYLAPECRDLVRERLERVFETGESDTYQVLGTGASGPSSAWYETRAVPVKHGNEVSAVTLITIDITERKRAEEEKAKLEEQLRHSEKMEAVGLFAGGIAHDFNNQLSGILGHADILKTKAEDEDLRHCAEMIASTAGRAADLTRQLLTFARKREIGSEPVDIHKIIAEVKSLLEHRNQAGIAVEERLDAAPPVAIGDASQLQNALLNIVINAYDAMPSGGKLTLRTETATFDQNDCGRYENDIAPGRYIRIFVGDTGTGMDEETRRRMFEPFFTNKKGGKGTGMGLSVVYGTVRDHNGALDVSSKPGVGTTFEVCLPMAENGPR